MLPAVKIPMNQIMVTFSVHERTHAFNIHFDLENIVFSIYIDPLLATRDYITFKDKPVSVHW